MGKRNYQRMAIEPFGRHLITTGDLDPVYIALQGLDDGDQLSRWLIAYWCFYHCGAASYMSERTGGDFWRVMHQAAENVDPPGDHKRWPRGHERRHARGKQGKEMVAALEKRYGDYPERMVNYICSGSHVYGEADQKIPFVDMSDRVKEHSLFGPWISFKVCDMVDRVLGIPVDFSQADVFMFDDPVKSAMMLWRLKMNMPETAMPKDKNAVIAEIVAYLKEEYKDLLAPPHRDRAIDLQEVETVLCKWKSHMNGHYPLYNDIDEIRKGLRDWGETADVFLAHMPEGSDA